MSNAANDPKWFRQVLGQYPTGVSVITAIQEDGSPAAMVVGSFTSVSLDPPLVAFLPDRNSSSWAKIKDCACFCVNILGAEQEDLCRRLSSKDPDKFAGVAHRASPSGVPVLNGVVAWIDCQMASIQEAGDHYIVVGSVSALGVESGGLPLLFFQGGYGRFSPLSLAAPDLRGTMGTQMRIVDIARPAMESMTSDLGGRCIASVRIGDELVIAASAGQARRGSVSTLVGQTLPFVPPTGSVFAAWMADSDVEHWLRTSPADQRAGHHAALERVKERGFSLGLISEAQRRFVSALENLAEGSSPVSELNLKELVQGLSYDPGDITPDVLNSVRLISAPVHDAGGEVMLALTLYEFPKPSLRHGVADYINRLVETAERVTREIREVSSPVK